jgi:hypothetical protein
MAILFGHAQLALVRGTRWDDDITLTDKATGEPVNLAGITGVLMRIREDIDKPIVLELSVANGRLVVVDAANGIMGIRVPSSATQVFPENGHKKSRYIYDVIIERSPSEYEPALSGAVQVLPQITRPWGAT